MSAHQAWTPPEVPSARVVRDGTRPVPKPTLRANLREWLTLSEGGRERLAILIGFWPLILVGGMAIALLWSAGYNSVQP